jgi:hypothetical protein
VVGRVSERVAGHYVYGVNVAVSLASYSERVAGHYVYVVNVAVSLASVRRQ